MTPAPVDALDLRERLMTLKQAAEVIPFPNPGALHDWLLKRKSQFPPRSMPFGRRDTRMLTGTEVRMIRAMRLEQGEEVRRKRRRHTPKKRVNP